MDRRRFLGLLGLAAPTYFFAPRGGWLKTGSVWMPSLTDGLPFYRDIDFNGKLYRVQEEFFKYPPHLVATGKLLTDLGEVVGVVRKAWPTLETDASLRQRMIMVMETMQV
jgi:hypothetical protein